MERWDAILHPPYFYIVLPSYTYYLLLPKLPGHLICRTGSGQCPARSLAHGPCSMQFLTCPTRPRRTQAKNPGPTRNPTHTMKEMTQPSPALLIGLWAVPSSCLLGTFHDISTIENSWNRLWPSSLHLKTFCIYNQVVLCLFFEPLYTL